MADEVNIGIKKVETEILKEFISVCEKLNLRYYVICGTLLGAVRHKGFIPWDDDIDVGMLREDYDIFVQKAPQHLRERYFLQTRKTDPNYIGGYAKLRDSNTTFIETVVKDIKMNHGMFLDIFPLDYFDEKKQKSLLFEKKVANERIMMEFIPTSARPLKYKILRPYAKWKYPSVEEAHEAREKMFRCTEKKEYVTRNSGNWGVKEIVPTEWFGEGAFLEFEGVRVMAPKEYDKWLTHVFGDYMQLPPAEKQHTYHTAEIIDAENSYLKYVNWGTK